MSGLTTKDALLVSICSQLPIGMIVAVLLAHVTSNFIIYFVSFVLVVFPTGFLVMWFAKQVKK